LIHRLAREAFGIVGEEDKGKNEVAPPLEDGDEEDDDDDDLEII
jgi:hypothetical protein